MSGSGLIAGAAEAHIASPSGAPEKEYVMRYMFAWLLGVPGIVIIAWYVVAHS
jgi:hypothetical protein